MHPLEDDLLGEALHLDEDVIERDLRLIVLEVMLLGTAVVRPQDVDLRVLPQTLHRVAVLRVKIGKVLKGELG